MKLSGWIEFLIDESSEHIKFFALPLGETGTNQKQINHLKEFYQEEHENGACVFIMEMYDQKYHMHGMPNSRRLLECVDNFSNHLYRSILAFEAL